MELRLDSSFYDLAQEAGWSLTAAALAAYDGQAPDLPPLLSFRKGLAESPSWILTQAIEFQPQPLSVDRFMVRAVYSAPGLVNGLFEVLAAEGWLERRGSDYLLTPAGQDIYWAQRDHQDAALVAFDRVAAPAFETLAANLGRVVGAAMVSEDVPSRWCLARSRNRAPSEHAKPVLRFVQLVDDLNALRDDAHLSAMGKYALPPAAREAFGFVCAGAARTADDLRELIGYRGFSAEDLLESLRYLAGAGLVEEAVDGFAPTESGVRARLDIEYLTDAYYYAPWSILGDRDMEETFEALLAVRDACTEVAV